MRNILTFMDKPTLAKGLNQQALPIQEKVTQHFFEENYNNLQLLKNIQSLTTVDNPILLYPGCGVDVLYPLHYFETLFPTATKAKFLFVDMDPCLQTIKTVLGDVGIHFEEKGNAVRFYWNNKLITLIFIQESISKIIHDLPDIDIYFERSFRIIRDNIPYYEQRILEKLNHNATLISDSGFQNSPLKKIKVPQELSLYKEMIIAQKLSQ